MDYETESLSAGFMRTMKRWGKILTGNEPALEDISSFRVGFIEASRARAEDRWNVLAYTSYMSPAIPCKDSFVLGGMPHTIQVADALKTDVDIHEALEIVKAESRCDARVLQDVADMAGHCFGMKYPRPSVR